MKCCSQGMCKLSASQLPSWKRSYTVVAALNSTVVTI